MRRFHGYRVKALYNDGSVCKVWYNAPNADNILHRINNDRKKQIFPIHEVKILSVIEDERDVYYID